MLRGKFHYSPSVAEKWVGLHTYMYVCMYVCVSCTYWLMHWSLSWLIPPENSWSPFMPRHWEGWVSEQASQSPCWSHNIKKRRCGRSWNVHHSGGSRAAGIPHMRSKSGTARSVPLRKCDVKILQAHSCSDTDKSMTFKLLQRWKGDPALVIKSFFNFASFFF